MKRLFRLGKHIFEWILYSYYWRMRFPLVETVYFTWKFFSTSGNRHWYEWKPIFKDRYLSCWWKLIFWVVKNNFLHCPRYFSRSSLSGLVEMDFSVENKKYCFLLRLFFPASENYYLDYTEVYLKLLLLLLATIFFDFLDVSVNGSSFSV